MSRTLKLLHQLLDPSDDTLLFGSGSVRKDISIAGDVVYRTTITVADDYNVETLWTAGDGGLDTYSHALILSDQDVLVEARNDDGTPKFAMAEVKANCPSYLGQSAHGATSTVFVDGSETTDTDNVDRLQVQRNAAEGQGDATVTLLLLA